MTLDDLRSLNMKDALVAANKLDLASRAQLLSGCAETDHRPLFTLRVVENLLMPDDLSIGITGLTSNADGAGTIGDFGEARVYIMKQLAVASEGPKVQRARTECWGHWFYPEFKNISNVRDRFATVAECHVKLNWMDLMQITLFSLNGFFDWNVASSSAHTFTTCGLFVRACRAAARILERKRWPSNASQGTDPCITGPGLTASVPYATRGDRTPRKGDIFHVATPGEHDDHVGVILQHHTGEDGSWIWRSAEGGQGSGYETRLFERKLPFQDSHHWHGEGKFRRRVIKWIDVEALAKAVA